MLHLVVTPPECCLMWHKSFTLPPFSLVLGNMEFLVRNSNFFPLDCKENDVDLIFYSSQKDS